MRGKIIGFCLMLLLTVGCKNNSINSQSEAADGRYSMLEPRRYEYQEGDYQTDWDTSIFNKDLYEDFYGPLKIAVIEYPDIKLEPRLKDYIVVDENDGEGKYDRMVGMFYDNRTLEIGEDALLELFIEHGYFLYFHYGKVGDLNFRIIEIQERDGLSIYPCRIVLQSWDDKYLYMQDITTDMPRKVRNIVTIDNREVPQIIIYAAGFTADYTSEAELIFLAFRRTGWVPCYIELKISEDEVVLPIYYSDGIAFPGVRGQTGGARHGNSKIYRLGILEELEKNKHFRLTGITEVAGVTVDASVHVYFSIVDE